MKSALLALVIAAGCVNAAPIAIHPTNTHYFSYHGQALALITSGEHYGAVLNRGFDYVRYLDTLQADKLNYTRIFGGMYVEVPGKSFGILRNDLAPDQEHLLLPWARSGTAGYAGGGNKFDLDHWNPEYFARLHAFLTAAEQHGVIVEITLFSSFYGDAQWAIAPINPANNVNTGEPIEYKSAQTLDNGRLLQYQEAYVRKLVHEVNAFDNVAFEIQNEPWSDHTALADVINPYLQGAARDRYPNSVDVADEPSMAWQARVASWVTSEESALPNQHLIAQNYSNFRYPVAAVAPGVKIVNFHYAFPEAVTLNDGLGIAIGCDETGFLGRGDEAYRRQAWKFLLAGGSLFDSLDYSFSPGHEDGGDNVPNGPGGGSPVLRHQLRVLSQFLSALPLAEMQPDTQWVLHSGGATPHALSDGSTHYALYLDGRAADLSLRLPAGSYAGSWVNPTTGATQPVRIQNGGGLVRLTPPSFGNGIALRLNRTGR